VSEPDSASQAAEVRRGLRAVRWLRRATWFCLGFPVLLTGLIVLANRLTSGGLSFFVSGAPWTHRFWS